MDTMIRTVDDVIDALGGDTVVGKKFRLSQSAVANWRIRGEIPGAWHLRIFVDLRRMGLPFDPAVFGLTEAESEALNHAPARPKRGRHTAHA